MDKVCLEGLVVEATIGVFAWEREIKQRLEVDVVLETDTRVAAVTDQLVDAVDYTQAAQCIVDICHQSRFHLLEALAEAIATELLTLSGVSALTLSIAKPSAVPLAKSTTLIINRP